MKVNMRFHAFLALVVATALQVHAGADPSGSVTIKGTRVATVGTPVEIGKPAPDFTALDESFQPVSSSQFRGKPVLISAVPSLDTQTCSLQTKRFNDELATLPTNVVILTISMDLPFAQKRFCSLEKIERVQVLSDSALREFGARYGVLIEERGLLARSVFVVGKDGNLLYKQIVPELSSQPDYDAALKAILQASEQTAPPPKDSAPR